MIIHPINHLKNILGSSSSSLDQTKMKKCIAVLTRGHENMEGYEELIKRNQCIDKHLVDKDGTDLLFFHEGNIHASQQEYIMSKTPHLRIRFVNVKEGNHAFRKEKEKVRIRAGSCFSMGYRHMCSFWFIDFWCLVKDYDVMLRIDEDCLIEFSCDWAMQELGHTFLLAGAEVSDEPHVVMGLNESTLQFVGTEIRNRSFHPRHPITGPYTNVFGINLKQIRRHLLLRKYIRHVEKSNRIYSHRWGDLPLWGEVVHYLLPPHSLRIDKRIVYYHGSHSRKTNG